MKNWRVPEWEGILWQRLIVGEAFSHRDSDDLNQRRRIASFHENWKQASKDLFKINFYDQGIANFGKKRFSAEAQTLLSLKTIFNILE